MSPAAAAISSTMSTKRSSFMHTRVRRGRSSAPPSPCSPRAKKNLPSCSAPGVIGRSGAARRPCPVAGPRAPEVESGTLRSPSAPRPSQRVCEGWGEFRHDWSGWRSNPARRACGKSHRTLRAAQSQAKLAPETCSKAPGDSYSAILTTGRIEARFTLCSAEVVAPFRPTYENQAKCASLSRLLSRQVGL